MHVAEFIAQKYYHDDTIEAVERVNRILSHPGIFFAGIPDNGVVLVYLTLSDEGLDILKSKTKQSDFNAALTRELLNYPGDHIYVFRIVSDDKPSLHILKILRSQIMRKHRAVSFSWHDNDHDNPVVLHTYKVNHV